MQLDMSLIDEAEFRGYIQFNEGRTRISYLCGRKYTDNFNDPEEKIRAGIYAWLILERGYAAERIEVETLCLVVLPVIRLTSLYL